MKDNVPRDTIDRRIKAFTSSSRGEDEMVPGWFENYVSYSYVVLN